jgi:gliding motility-associated protein GldE
MNPDAPVPLGELLLTPGFLIPASIMLILLFLSALVSGSEVAFFSMGPADIQKLREDENGRGGRILRVLETPDLENGPRNLLATILVLNNFINIVIILLSTLLVESILPAGSVSDTVSFAVNIVGVTLLIVLFGEVIPKVYATNYRHELAGAMAVPLQFAQSFLYVLWKPLVAMGAWIERNLKTSRNENVSVEELEHALELTDNEGRSEEEKKIFEGIVNFGMKDVKQVMTPRTDVFAVNAQLGWDDLVEQVLDNGFSRVPVYSDSVDQIAGILYIKDLLPHIDQPNFDWTTLLRAPFYVPENKKIDDLLREFQGRKMHMAVVVDEYGGTSGIVTLEDVLEEIVGEITDEFDEDDVQYSKLDDANYVFEGKTALIDMYRVLDIDGSVFEAAKGDSDTLAGFVIELAGKIPMKGERYTFDRFTFTVEASDRRRLKRVKLTLDTEQRAENS